MQLLQGRYLDAKEVAMALLAWEHKYLNWRVMEQERA